MIKRICIDGNRNLVNFGLKLGEINVLLGSSGAGKRIVASTSNPKFVPGYGTDRV